MFSQVVKRVPRVVGAQRRGLHAETLESIKVFASCKEATPLVVIVGFALGLMCWKGVHDMRSPEAHFSRVERSTLDYLENERSNTDEVAWANTSFHKGPSFRSTTLVRKQGQLVRD